MSGAKTPGPPCPRCKRPTPDGLLCDPCMTAFRAAVGPAQPGAPRLSLTELLPELAVLVRRQDQVARAVDHQVRPAPAETAQAAQEQRAVPAWLRSKLGRIALPATALPVDLDAAATQRQVIATVRAALQALRTRRPRVAGPVCEACGHESCDQIRWVASDAALRPLAWLAAHAADVRRWPGGPQLVDDLTRAARRIEQLIDTRAPDLYLGPCTAPDVKTSLHPAGIVQIVIDQACNADVYAFTHDTQADCPRCGTSYLVADRREWVLTRMRDLWVRPADIADALSSLEFPLSRGLLDQWISRDRRWPAGRPWPHAYPRIVQVAVDDDGRALYRFGDVAGRVEFLRAQRAEAERVKETG